MLMDSESQPPPAKRMRDEDYLGTSLIISPPAGSINEFNFPSVDSVGHLHLFYVCTHMHTYCM